MKIHRDILMGGSRTTLAAMMEHIQRSLSDGWTHNCDAEEKLKNGPTDCWFAFDCGEKPGRRAASLFITSADPCSGKDCAKDIWHVANIVPAAPPNLPRSDYNAIVADFAARFVIPAAEKFASEIDLKLTPADVELDHWMSAVTADKLRGFARSANKSTGSEHPSDQRSWFDFLVTAQKEKCRMPPGMLKRWLIEVEEWPQDVALELSHEYEFAGALLDFASRS